MPGSDEYKPHDGANRNGVCAERVLGANSLAADDHLFSESAAFDHPSRGQGEASIHTSLGQTSQLEEQNLENEKYWYHL